MKGEVGDGSKGVWLMYRLGEEAMAPKGARERIGSRGEQSP